jgi:hypothetical protein
MDEGASVTMAPAEDNNVTELEQETKSEAAFQPSAVSPLLQTDEQIHHDVHGILASDDTKKHHEGLIVRFKLPRPSIISLGSWGKRSSSPAPVISEQDWQAVNDEKNRKSTKKLRFRDRQRNKFNAMGLPKLTQVNLFEPRIKSFKFNQQIKLINF